LRLQSSFASVAKPFGNSYGSRRGRGDKVPGTKFLADLG